MRMMKKVMTGMSLAAAALAIAGGVNAANADAASVTINADQTMTISGDKEVWVSYDAVKDKKGVATWNAKAKWDVYDSNGDQITVDLSTVKYTKDAYITVRDSSTTSVPVAYKLTAALNNHKLKGKYAVDAGTLAGKIDFQDALNKNAAIDMTASDAPALEYRTVGNWVSYNNKNFLAKEIQKYEKQGATLYFRYAASTLAFDTAVESEDGTFQIRTQNEGNFASAEVKVKIAKEANAPTATIDYDKGTFKVKAGTEIRNIVGTSYSTAVTAEGNATAAKQGKFVEPIDLVVPIDKSKDGIFEVRTAANATKKKIASKVGVYVYKGTAALNAKLIELTKTVEKDSKNGKLNVTFSNKDAVSYLVYTVNPDLAENATVKPVATIKAYGEKGYKDVVVKGKIDAGTQLYVVSASDKKNGVFRSPALGWETVEDPAPPVVTDPEEE